MPLILNGDGTVTGLNAATSGIATASSVANIVSSKVLQVVSASGPATNLSGTASSPGYLGASASITPSSSQNKVLILATINSYAGAQYNIEGVTHFIYRGGSQILSGSNGQGRPPGQDHYTSVSASNGSAYTILDSPATTASITYSVYAFTYDTRLTYGISAGQANITLMEIVP